MLGVWGERGRLRPISISANFRPKQEKVGPEAWGPEGWGPKDGGTQNLALFSLSRHCFHSRGFTRQPESPNVHISGSRRFKHHQNSTKGPQEKEERMKTVAGGKKE